MAERAAGDAEARRRHSLPQEGLLPLPQRAPL